MLRPAHQKQVSVGAYSSLFRSQRKRQVRGAAILRNSEIAAKGVLPTCQATGTAIIVGKKGRARVDRRR
ncbi:fumarate hydratase [Escherichia coli]